MTIEDRADQAGADHVDPGWSPWRAACLLGAGAAFIRVLWVLVMSREPEGLTDLTLYPLFAEGIAEGRGYLSLGQHPTAYYPPGYPYFLGAIQWLLDRVALGEHLVLVAGLVQALLGGLAVSALVIASERLGGRRVALIAGAILALWPNLVVHSSLMLSETLFIAVFCVTLAALVRVTDAPRSVVRIVGRGGRRPWPVHADPSAVDSAGAARDRRRLGARLDGSAKVCRQPGRPRGRDRAGRGAMDHPQRDRSRRVRGCVHEHR
ncbi:MAG: hypothetical protein V9E94_11420 [Microthrixaceae bacterium]